MTADWSTESSCSEPGASVSIRYSGRFLTCSKIRPTYSDADADADDDEARKHEQQHGEARISGHGLVVLDQVVDAAR
ncbi:MAG TPA: hypothetical protein VMU39_02345 [Solirubrobacteraceae bacterium]|nr:hypothetical protein [Solirubrobacteraceae bacterium]